MATDDGFERAVTGVAAPLWRSLLEPQPPSPPRCIRTDRTLEGAASGSLQSRLRYGSSQGWRRWAAERCPELLRSSCRRCMSSRSRWRCGWGRWAQGSLLLRPSPLSQVGHSLAVFEQLAHQQLDEEVLVHFVHPGLGRGVVAVLVDAAAGAEQDQPVAGPVDGQLVRADGGREREGQPVGGDQRQLELPVRLPGRTNTEEVQGMRGGRRGDGSEG